MPVRETMTPRERWQAAIRMQPVDRLPFWPKIGSNYAAMQSEPFNSMNTREIHDWIGSDKHEGIGVPVKTIRRKTSQEVDTQPAAGGKLQTTRYITPRKTLTAVARFDEASHAWHPVKFPVETLDDLHALTDWFRDATVEFDAEQHEKAIAREKEIGQSAVVVATAGTSALMQWIEWLAGIERAHYMLADYPEDIGALFAELHRILMRTMEIAAGHTPADMIYLTENTSTTLVSPEQYRRWCFPQIRECAQAAVDCGKPVVLHMCGHLKDVLPDLGALSVAAFEAFTTPTLGNTTLLEGRTACPNTCIIGGTNAMLWLKPADQIAAKIESDLDVLPHHRGIVVTSAGVMPPFCRPETIKTVCDWVKEYKMR